MLAEMRAAFFSLLIVMACKHTSTVGGSSAGGSHPSPTDPPVVGNPVQDLPKTDPPVTEPPVTDPPVTEPPVTDPPVTVPPIVAAPYGLDARPSNTTCVAQPPPVPTGALQFTQVFENMATAGFLINARATRINGKRWWIAGYRDGTMTAYRQDDDDGDTVASGVPFLHVDHVTTVGEAGMLGVALDPDYPNTPRVYVYYSRVQGDGVCPARQPGEVTWDDQLCNYLSRFTVTPSVGSDGTVTFTASAEDGVPLNGVGNPFYVRKPATNHNGGGMTFGRSPDDYLYLTIGDGGGGDDTFGNGQNKTALLAKVLRIDVRCATLPCDIPADNPTTFGPRSLIFAMGLRNPWRLSVDRATGDLWTGDVGQSYWEEFDHIVSGGNYGWSVQEGTHCRGTNDALSTCPLAGAIAPVMQYMNVGNAAAPSGYPTRQAASGGFVYRGTHLSSYVGHYFFGDFESGEVWELAPPFDGPSQDVSSAGFVGNTGGAALFFEDERGELYVTDDYVPHIYRIDAKTASQTSTFPTQLSQTGCFSASDPTQPTAGLIPYDVASPLWSDGADKRRWMALPDGATITVDGDGDFVFPVGSVMAKEFSLAGKRLETRLLMHHADGSWGGYTYAWNDAQTDAALIDDAQTKTVGAQTWYFPSRADCLHCHTSVAQFTLGPELAQLNRDYVYASTSKRSNQLATLAHIGLIADPGDPSTLAALPDPAGAAAQGDRARSYLHANCAMCHQPGGPTPAGIDLRYTTGFADTHTCNAAPTQGDAGLSSTATIVTPGASGSSVLHARMVSTTYRMPPLATKVVDDDGAALIASWIDNMTQCPAR